MLAIELCIIVVLISVNGLLAMSELAIVSSRPARLRRMVEMKVNGSRRALSLASDPGKFLSTVQIGITLVGVLSGAFSGATIGLRLAQWLVSLGASTGVADTIGIGTVVAFVAYLRQLYGPVSELANVHVDAMTSLALFERLFGYLDLVPEISEPPNALVPPPARGEVPRHAAQPPHRVVIRGDRGPSGQCPDERLVGQVLGLVHVADVRVHLDRERMDMRGVELFEVPAHPASPPYEVGGAPAGCRRVPNTRASHHAGSLSCV